MAACTSAGITSYRNVTELENYFLDDVRRSQIKPLGCGTFGVVEEVTVGGTTCVSKLMHKSLIDKEADIKKQSKRFSSACELLSKPQFCHPNIVPLMGLCMFDENVHPVLVMERVDESLESIVMTFKSVVPLPLILHVVKDVTKGLIFMHNYDPAIVHHNLTARNVLVSRTTMIAKIADIGDSLIVYPETFLGTLLHSPAIVPYMPPEVLYRKPNRSCMLDMFSFGHLVLTSTIQKFPLANDLKEPTYIDVKTRESKARSEVERREEFVKMLYSKLTRDHKLTQMVLQCLHDMPGKRLTALKVLGIIADVFVDEDPYRGDVDLVKLLNMSDCDQQAFNDATGMSLTVAGSEDFLKHRVMEIKNGGPVVLDIFRYHGRLKRKQDWRRQMFQIKDGFLKYFKSNPVDGSHDELELTSVVCVNACPPKEKDSESLFYFEIHYTGRKGSPWLLRAYTQDDRACWMEAIQPGSSAFFRFPQSNEYEKVSFESDARIYDEPEIAVSQYLESKGSHHPVTAAAPKSNRKTKSAPSELPCHVCSPPETPKSLNDMPPNEIIPHVVERPRDLENQFYNLDPNKAQLLMLLQMQQMVQKMEEYERAQKFQKGVAMPYEYSIHAPSQKLSQMSDSEVKGSTVTKKITDKCTTNKKITRELPRLEMYSGSEQPLTRDALPRRRAQSDPCVQYKPVLSSLEKSTKSSQSLDNLCSSVLMVSPSSAPGGYKKSAHQQRQDKMSHQDIISALSKTISPKIASHLVTDDSIYASGNYKRPEWTKAKTQSSGIELSLDDIHQNALWIPRSSLQNLKEIGKGQYGTVYKGEYRRLDGPKYFVAIKTIRQHESEKEQFLTEMRVMSNMIHPNIIRLFGLVQQDEPWIVLEYLPNGDLNTFLKKKTQPLNKIIKYMLDVATGMHYISERGLVHRDLAARNIMVSQDEICKVGDFGLLRKIPKDAKVYIATSEFPFPLRWMAPESLKKKEFSPASDVWSFGVVMWEMYNPNKLPYDDMNDMECAVNVSQGARLTIPKPYPETLVKIMKACWQIDPSKRPSFLLCAALLTDMYLKFQE